MRVVLLFSDGVGIGVRDPAVNPLARGRYLLSQFASPGGLDGEPLPDGGAVHPVDATFGLPGRPQSASNQTALLTGDPAPSLLGRHVLGFPDSALRQMLGARSIVKRLTLAGRRACLANCYPAGYLDTLGLFRRPSARPEVAIAPRAARRLKAPAAALAFAAAGIGFRTLDDARSGEGLTHDIDGERAQAHGFDVPRRSPEEAAELLWRLGSAADFTFFEHYLADEAGHAQDFGAAKTALGAFDRFARAVVARRPPEACVLICSDHGNVEDLSLRGHTRNPVAVLAFGASGRLGPLSTLAHVGQAVLFLLGLEAESRPAPWSAVGS